MYYTDLLEGSKDMLHSVNYKYSNKKTEGSLFQSRS